ncbi:hypothetical protein EDC96DRAFT_128344 [Choanephora cucurbitarum]|nr:hypothetical protein EDC96DRAFT_128344 [Choanephora cucurbitarum]
MSFKSKQRAKHGHLFGDDPLNASLQTTSDDPLFTSQSTRTDSPQDPLSRPNTSSSTPVFHSPRRAKQQGSIFGDIDVSKLGNKKTPLRSTATLRQYDLENEEDLFGGNRKKTSTKTSPSSSIHKKSPILTHQEPPIPPAIQTEPVIEQPKDKIDEKTPERSSSFFRFFKTSSSSKTTSSASSVKSIPSSEQQNKPEEVVVIEDEATRAFADDMISFQSKPTNYLIMTPELTMDALKLNTPPIPTTTSSSSVSTHSVDDPWLDPTLQPATVDLAIQVQDIEPQKRTAFADLIDSWNTSTLKTHDYLPKEEEEPDQFFDHVAEERRDIGFAGIEATTRKEHPIEWVTEEENPWH